MTEPYRIFFSVDDNYVPALTIALRSLVANTDPQKSYHVTILTEGLTQPHQAQLLKEASANVTVDFNSITDRLKARITDKGNTLRADYFTFTIYFRLFIAELFPTLDKALYLDADTVILTDVADLFELPLNGNFFGAVPDPFIAGDPVTVRYAEDAIGIPVSHYVNSGVLIMDLKALRAAGFSAHFLNLLNDYHFASLAPDQDYINAIAQHRIQFLDPSWNTQGTQKGIDQPHIVHFNLYDKPWHYADVANDQYFWQYAAGTPEEAGLKATQAAWGKTGEQTDATNQAKLMQLARDIVTVPVTFKNMQAQGVQVAL
ncbi:glycosyltransferase family 8 protein [Lacticaseibacillus mingshuiensis]|uniref:Glycosyltransferase family 8 protein n=1 Tax=Lacticaseibacillus mingshuiensis TaxID=2799574 RepID=A0ABW4CJW6_9LACO|nr:glycosyltransferase family 8 protein [Lacticaseibacillus mingshuiensis]